MKSSQSTRVVAPAPLLICFVSVFFAWLFSRPTKPTLLRLLADNQFAWGSSTTSVPISAVSVYAKSLLSRDVTALPPKLRPLVPTDGHTLRLQPVRDVLNAERLVSIRSSCENPDGSIVKACNVNAPHPEFGLTPLHLAAYSNDSALADWLVAHGAKPVADSVGRLPANLTFANFIANAKRAKPAGSDCDFPAVDLAADTEHALREITRLVGEGEPLLIRNAYSYYAQKVGVASEKTWNVSDWIRTFGDSTVTFGSVPYANAFNLSTSQLPLRDYFSQFVTRTDADNVYVFNKNADICADGYRVISAMVKDRLPSNQIVHPDSTGELDGIHYFFGRARTGAPFHVHADAINAAVHGRKKWFAYTPSRTIYSRKTTARWVDEDLPLLPPDERPLECTQYPGDFVYVPLDWGHAVLNLDDNTFGFALEVLNRRDTFAHITGHA